jgi:type IV pilus assembly protein PilA
MLSRLQRAHQRARQEEGFTLIELLVVILIIGILAAVAIPAFLSQRSKAYDANAKSDVSTAQTAAEAYGLDNNGSYASMLPSSLVSQEATLTSANVLQAGGNASGYTVGVTSKASGTGNPITYAITRTSLGNTDRTCGAGGMTIKTDPSTDPTFGTSGVTSGGCNAGTW